MIDEPWTQFDLLLVVCVFLQHASVDVQMAALRLLPHLPPSILPSLLPLLLSRLDQPQTPITSRESSPSSPSSSSSSLALLKLHILQALPALCVQPAVLPLVVKTLLSLLQQPKLQPLALCLLCQVD
jgi:hypothetical protein